MAKRKTPAFQIDMERLAEGLRWSRPGRPRRPEDSDIIAEAIALSGLDQPDTYNVITAADLGYINTVAGELLAAVDLDGTLPRQVVVVLLAAAFRGHATGILWTAKLEKALRRYKSRKGATTRSKQNGLSSRDREIVATLLSYKEGGRKLEAAKQSLSRQHGISVRHIERIERAARRARKR